MLDCGGHVAAAIAAEIIRNFIELCELLSFVPPLAVRIDFCKPFGGQRFSSALTSHQPPCPLSDNPLAMESSMLYLSRVGPDRAGLRKGREPRPRTGPLDLDVSNREAVPMARILRQVPTFTIQLNEPARSGPRYRRRWLLRRDWPLRCGAIASRPVWSYSRFTSTFSVGDAVGPAYDSCRDNCGIAP